MPIHNWTFIDFGLFHDFHQSWTINICTALNSGLLPRQYSALVEPQSASLFYSLHGAVQTYQSGCVTHESPRTRYTFRAEQVHSAAMSNRITIQYPLGRVISVIEIVSPGNKSSRSTLRSFVEKTVEFLNKGVHILVVDLFPPSIRDPQGIHKAIWDEIEEKPFQLPADKPLTLVAYVADYVKTAYVEPVGTGDVLPDMPAYLDPDSYVPVPLEATYEATWLSCPKVRREAVERGEPLSEEMSE